MNEFTQNNNVSMYTNAKNSSGSLVYDLVEEKRRIALGTEELKKEIQEKWNKKYANAQIFPAPIAMMHPDVVDFLLSFSLVNIYDNIAKQVGLDEQGRDALPQVVWQISQTKKWDSLDETLEAQIPLVHSAHVSAANLLQQNILDKVKILSEKTIIEKVAYVAPTKKEIQLPLSEILSQYPKVEEQHVTTDQIRLQNYPTPVRPSVRNWITAFHEAMGAGKHSPIDRGNFLFHSENGKPLSSSERQKVATILKSLDEQTLLTIDTESEIIVFNSEELPNRVDIAPQVSQVVVESEPVSFAPIVAPNVVEKKSTVVLKEMAFSPGLVKTPDVSNVKKVLEDDKEERRVAVNNSYNENLQERKNPYNLLASRQVAALPDDKNNNFVKKEEIFSISSSKPPIGTDEYHIKETEFVYADNETKKENISEMNSAVVSQPNIISNISFKPSAPHFHMEKVENKDVIKKDIVPLVHIPTKPVVSLKKPSIVKPVEMPKPKVEAPKKVIAPPVAIQNPEELSDEMLFKMYQEKKLAKSSTLTNSKQSPSQSIMNPYHISPTHSNNEPEKIVKMPKNVVNLKQ